jgi:hypothetical protein
MLVTPLLNAGIYYSFHNAVEGAGTQVLNGMKKCWKPVFGLYWLEKGLILLPAFWILPIAESRFLTEASLSMWLQDLLPYAAVWTIWGLVIHLVFQFMQFGAVSREGTLKGLLLALRKALPLFLVTLILIGFGLAVSASAWAVSMLWSGFIAVMLHQAFHFVRTLLALWTSACQYRVWHD